MAAGALTIAALAAQGQEGSFIASTVQRPMAVAPEMKAADSTSAW